MSHIVGDDANFKTEVLDFKGKVLVDFWATWCGPCQMLAPTMDELGDELKDKVKVVKLDVDASSTTASQFGVSSIPTVILFVDGKPVDTLVGFRQKQDYLAMVEKNN